MKKIISFNVLKGQYTLDNSRDYFAFVNLDDYAEVELNEKHYCLNSRDVIVSNPLTSMKISGNCLLVFRIDIDQFRELFNGKQYYFNVNSCNEDNNNYELLVNKLLKLVVKKEEKGVFSQVEYRQIENDILIFLIDNFSISDVYESNDKLSNILDYIAVNCTNEMSLNNISEHFGFTPQYFSRFFKEKMNVTFHHYLNDMRLQRSIGDLLYSQKTILKLALDNGFPNVSSYNKAFLHKYGVRPLDYKQSNVQELNLIEDKLHIHDILDKINVEDQYENGLVLNVDCRQVTYFNKYWKRVFNLGDIGGFYDRDVQQQLLMLQQNLKFEYIRLNLTMPENFQEEYYFYNEERIFDALIDMSFKLWLMIDLRNINEHFIVYFKKLLSHFANRYSIDNVRFWTFELLYETIFDEKKCQYYFKIYEKFNQILKHFGCVNDIVGPGMLLGQMNSLEEFMHYIEQHNLQMKNISFSADTFDIQKNGNQYIALRNKDVDHLKNKLHMIKNRCAGYFKEIMITNWNSSVIGNNIFNDTCYKGAYIVKNIIDCYGYSDALCYSECLDLLSRNEKNGVLIGAEGLVTKHGIRKPAFYAYDFLNRLGKYFICKDDYSFVATNGQNYNIVCHNCKRLGYKYYLEEENLDNQHLNEYFDDLTTLRLNYHFEHIKNGSYLVKIRTINEKHGSVYDILYSSFDNDVSLGNGEFEYLYDLSIPTLKVFKVEVANESLNLSVELLANEIKYMHIIYLY